MSRNVGNVTPANHRAAYPLLRKVRPLWIVGALGVIVLPLSLLLASDRPGAAAKPAKPGIPLVEPARPGVAAKAKPATPLVLEPSRPDTDTPLILPRAKPLPRTEEQEGIIYSAPVPTAGDPQQFVPATPEAVDIGRPSTTGIRPADLKAVKVKPPVQPSVELLKTHVSSSAAAAPVVAPSVAPPPVAPPPVVEAPVAPPKLIELPKEPTVVTSKKETPVAPPVVEAPRPKLIELPKEPTVVTSKKETPVAPPPPPLEMRPAPPMKTEIILVSGPEIPGTTGEIVLTEAGDGKGKLPMVIGPEKGPDGKLPPVVGPKGKDEVAPPPRPFGPRLPVREGDKEAGFGSTPRPTKKDIEEFGKFVDTFVDPRNTLDLVVRRTRLMVLKEVPTKTQIADEEVAGMTVIDPKQIALLGKKVGTTVLTLWFPDPDAKDKKDKILSFLVRVIPDPEERARLERVYKALEEEINETFPDSVIHLKLVGDKLVVSGQARDIMEATQILRIVRANAPPTETAKIPVDSVNVNVTPDGRSLPALRDFLIAGGPNVINLIRVPGEQQVMLKVTVAEINRSAARSIGLNFSIFNNQGTQVFANNTGNIAAGGTAGVLNNMGQNLGLLTNNLPVALDNGQITLAINALRTLNYARSLAEPNLVALNGQTARFQAGGSFPVPVIAAGSSGDGGTNGGNLQGVNFVPFGVLLNFTPYVTDKDQIRLTVAAEVSTRDLAGGANINGTNVPGLNTRNFETTVQLREGQTLAVAGLIQNNIGGDSTRVPGIGDIPILSRLTGFDRLTAGEQELVVLVTPELVSPLDAKELPQLPGSDVFEPGDLEFYVCGRLESRRSYDYRSSVRTDWHRMRAYRRCEQQFIFGPSGHSDLKLFEVPNP